MTTYKCDDCRCTHTCTLSNTLNDRGDPLPAMACPYREEDDWVGASWKIVEAPGPFIPDKWDSEEIDALLEVIKQKDSIIDNCRSSLEEYRQKSYEYMGEIGYLKKTSDPDLYQKCKDEESRATTLETKLKYAEERVNEPWYKAKLWFCDLLPMTMFLVFLGGIVGVFVGLCL